MSELLSQLITPEIQAAFSVVVVLLAILYILSIVWVGPRCVYARHLLVCVGHRRPRPACGASWRTACCVRPCCRSTVTSRELEVALKQRQLMHYGECANCGYPVESDYVLCPNCHQRLKNLCGHCGHALEPAWTGVPVLRKPGQRPAPGGSPRPAASGRPASAAPARPARPEE